jgi:8-oxo-dGTP pyrophosphatase MutT (NUDIX family)
MDTAHQVAALVVRRTSEGAPLVLLVTSRDTGRWVIPKGWPQQDQPDHVTASQEALEEAGVTGVMLPDSIGSYLYRKRLPTETIDVRVRVFMLNFTGELESWRESDQRQRLWCTPAVAATKVAEPELQQLILSAEWT